jgi:hypothetical protein
MISGNRIDTSLLVRKVPLLSMIQKHQFTWNQVGENLLENAPKPRNHRRENGFSVEKSATATAQSSWAGVKSEMFRLLATDAPEYGDIRKRLVGAGDSSTLYVLSTLSLWLAGAMGISVSVTTPVVATMLYAIAQSPAAYGVLLEG